MLRWVVCPVIEDIPTPDEDWVGPGEPVRRPKLAGLIDPSTGREYAWSAAIDLKNWCVVAVFGNDFTPLDADSQIISLLEMDFEGAEDVRLLQTPKLLGWNAARVNRLRTRLEARGVDTTGLTNTSPLIDWLRAILKAIHPAYEPVGMRAKL